jgi:hypothetical protein
VVYCQLYVYDLGRGKVEMAIGELAVAGFQSRVQAAEDYLLRKFIGEYM